MSISGSKSFFSRFVLVVALALAGCGGGGELAGVDSGGTGSFAVGTISGFGSVVVNDIRYDDRAATVQDAYGTVRTRAELRLGMVVEVEGSALTTAPAGSLHEREGVASEIRISAEIVGPLLALDPAASQLVVLGQTVEVSPTTIFGDELAGGLATIAQLPPGSVLEVHGYPGHANSDRYLATRIDVRLVAEEYRLVGIVRNLDAGARRFSVGEAWIDYAALGNDEAQAAGVVEGGLARLRLGTMPRGDGTWAMLQAESAAPQWPDRDNVDIEGPVNDVSGDNSFEVNGVPVDSSNAIVPPDLQIGSGARITVEGRLSGGVLVADVIRVVQPEPGAPQVQGQRITLQGSIASLALGSRQMRVRGVRVNFVNAELDGGTLAELRNGIVVEVDGRLAGDGSSVEASRIRFASRNQGPGGNNDLEQTPGNSARPANSPSPGNSGTPGNSGAPGQNNAPNGNEGGNNSGNGNNNGNGNGNNNGNVNGNNVNGNGNGNGRGNGG